jgi:hypothetical protein
LLLLESLIETPGLVERLVEVLRPAAKSGQASHGAAFGGNSSS